MAKQSGLGDNLYVAGFDLSGDIGTLDTISGPTALLDVTSIDKSAMQRIGGIRDGMIEYTAFFDQQSGQAHPTLKSLPTTDRVLTYCRGTALGSPAACLNAKQINYDPSRGSDGSLTFKVSNQGSLYGLEWGTQLTAGKRTDTTATSPGTGVDFTTVSTAFGWQAYLQVFTVTGTSVTVTLQDSADNSAFTNLTGAAFTAATPAGSPQTQRLEGGRTATVRRYLRAITTGTFSNAVFSVVFVRNDVAVAF